MTLLTLLLLSLAALLPIAKADDTACSAFTVNGSEPATFAFYRFYDFRNVSASGSASSGRNASEKGIDSDSLTISKSTNDSSWTDDWAVTVKYREAANKNRTAIHYVSDNVFMGGEDGASYLILNTSRLANKTQLGGQISYQPAKVDAISLRVSARVSGDGGAVAGFFTYHNDTQESDIEIINREGDDHVHFSNQPTEDDRGETITGATFNVSMPEGTSNREWAVYRLDWLSGANRSVWYVDGQQLAETQTNIPSVSSTVFLNMWSNGGPWSGGMAVGGEAKLEVQWIEMAFNASATVEDAPDRGSPCSIDEHMGTPVSSGGGRFGAGAGVWLVFLMAASWMAL